MNTKQGVTVHSNLFETIKASTQSYDDTHLNIVTIEATQQQDLNMMQFIHETRIVDGKEIEEYTINFQNGMSVWFLDQEFEVYNMLLMYRLWTMFISYRDTLMERYRLQHELLEDFYEDSETIQ